MFNICRVFSRVSGNCHVTLLLCLDRKCRPLRYYIFELNSIYLFGIQVNFYLILNILKIL